MSYSAHLHNNFGRNRFTTPKTLTLADYVTNADCTIHQTRFANQIHLTNQLVDAMKSAPDAHEANQLGMDEGKPPVCDIGQMNATDDEMLNKAEDEDEILGNKDNNLKKIRKPARGGKSRLKDKFRKVLQVNILGQSDKRMKLMKECFPLEYTDKSKFDIKCFTASNKWMDKLATQQNGKTLVWSAPANGNALEKLKQRRALKEKPRQCHPVHIQ
eukprot:jgi/Psemu1/37034/gm1.37034_g